MQRIVPNIWCNGNADEMAEFYLAAFDDAHKVAHQRYPEAGLLDFQQPMAGKTLLIELSLRGFHIMLINADDTFTPNPSISLMVSNPTPEATTALYQHLAEGGLALMPLGSYAFNEHYAWVQDKYGVSWQLFTHTPPTDLPAIYPSLMFCGQAQNRASEAMDRYTELFGGQVTQKVTYGDLGQGGNGVIEPESVVFATIELAGQTIGVMDSAVEQPFSFDGGVALLVNAHGQEAIDHYFDGLSAVPEAERCGWLRDEFGVSWEIVPDNLGELMAKPNAYEKLMGMGKIIIKDFSEHPADIPESS